MLAERPRRLATICLVFLALPAVAAAPRAASPPQCMQVIVSAVEDGGAIKQGKRFSTSTTLDLTFTVLLAPTLTGEHTLEVRAFLPTGYLYQSMTVPVLDAATDTGTQQDRLVRGYPHPVPAVVPKQAVVDGLGVLRVDVPFPVAGTAITSNSLFGKWTALAHLDGDTTPCGKKVEFTLVE